jgi:hypothetical protein
MKNLLFSLIANVLIMPICKGQESKIISGKITIGSTITEIPGEIKSDLEYIIDSSDFIKHERFAENLGGYVTVISDNRDKIVAVVFPVTSATSKMNPLKCFKTNFWGSGGGWSGFWDCILN